MTWKVVWLAVCAVQTVLLSSAFYGEVLRSNGKLLKTKDLADLNESRYKCILFAFGIGVIPVVGLLLGAWALGVIEIKFDSYYLNFALPFGIKDRRLRKNVVDPNVQQRLYL